MRRVGVPVSPFFLVIALSALESLKHAKSLHDVAALLGYSPSGLSFILYKIPKNRKYVTFAIPKKGGGERQIDAPVPRLKVLQKKLADILYQCARDIEDATKQKNTLSHAFRNQYSIITNAHRHTARRYVLNLDLQNLFPTLNFGRVRGFFIKNKHFGIEPNVATIIAQIACNDGVLPQGSPCSPIVSELVTHFLDVRLARLASQNKCTYTRYADDITFSTNQKDFPTALAAQTDEGRKLGDSLRERIEHSGFKINDAKTRMQCRGSRQNVTGLIVNKKVNIPASYYKLSRAMVHSFLTTGKYTHDGEEATSIEILEGVLNHVYHVKERLIDINISKENNAAKRKKLLVEHNKSKYEYPSAIRVLYHKLIFYKHFIDPKHPLILCEGPTDPVYLKAAIRKLAAAHPKLAAVAKGSLTLKIKFFKYSQQSKDILQLRGGVSDLKYFLLHWKKLLPNFGNKPTKHPVIVFIDNDSGSEEIFSVLSNLFNVTANLKTDLPFYHLGGHLYLIKTPMKGGDGSSYIENFLPDAALQTLIEGKSFSPNKEHQAPNEYGKVILAEKVVRPNAAVIDFSGFESILARIDAVIEDYEKQPSLAAAQAKKMK